VRVKPVLKREKALLTDEQVIADVRRGEGRKYALLVERHKDRAFSLALRLTGSREDAEEIVQDAFLRAYRSLNLFRGEARFGTWLYRIVYNLSISRISRTKTWLEYRDMSDDRATHAGEQEVEQPSIVDIVEESELHEVVMREIATLPPLFRSAVTLFYIDDMTYEEVGDIMEIPLGTVKTYLFRGRNLLRKRIDERLKGEVQTI
jgi:RNA polymerase sigma-70 factor (ECF subfamily)